MKKINWLYVGIGAVVLYLVWKKFGQGSNGETYAKASGFWGRKPTRLKAGTLPTGQVCCEYADGTSGISTSGCTQNYMGFKGWEAPSWKCRKRNRS